MLTFLCSFAITGSIVYALYANGFATEHPNWTVFIAVIIFLLLQLAAGFIIRFFTKGISARLQVVMLETQEELTKKQNQFMRRPMSQEMMMSEFKRVQNMGLNKMMEILKQFKPLYWWNFMLKKQVNTMRMQFLFQQEKFDEVDKLMPDCLLLDSTSVCMSMARMYVNKTEDKKLDKLYRKKCLRMKGDDATITLSTYAWILVKRERIDDAIQALAEGKVRTKDNPVVVKNWENLVNKKIKHFSNSQLGDKWYVLGLEKPKMQRMQQQQVRYR